MNAKSVVKGILIALLATVGVVLFVWLIVLKLMTKLFSGHGHGGPCPACLGFLVNNPIRRRYTAPVLDRVGILSGDTVLEVGPGPGAFTPDIARRVGQEGRVIAVDIQPKMIALLEGKLHEAGLSDRVETHVADAHELPLDPGTADRAFMVTVLPEIPDPVGALREIRRVLKPGGILSITEEFLDPDYPLRTTTRRWAAEAGFECVEHFGNFWLYTINFRKPLA